MVLLGSDTDKVNDFLSDYTDFVTELYKTGNTDLSQHLLKITLDCENIYTQLISAGKKPDKNIQDCLIHELQFLQEVSQLTPEDLTEELDYSGYLPRWDNSPIDFIGSYSERMSLAAKRGFGKWAKSSMFVLRGGELTPVKFPDKQTLAELYGYERERKAVIDNTLALLNGKPALNALLYGDAGTGKLTITANTQNAVSCNNDLKFTGGDITVKTLNKTDKTDAVKGKTSVTVKGGKLTIDAEGDGLKSSKGNVMIEG
jgi:hypothetical protein